MAQIIPAIIAKDFKDLQGKIKLVEPYVSAVQLDVMDGVFVNNTTWPFGSAPLIVAQGEQGKLNDLEKFDSSIFLEAHLMVEWSEEMFENWLASKVGRIILHWEAIERSKLKNQNVKIQNLIIEAHEHGKEIGIAINSETPIEVLGNFISQLDLVLLMSVSPGFDGQKFREEIIPKIVGLRARNVNVKIEVDGGINKDNAKAVNQAGADFLVCGSAIFSGNDVGKAIEEIKKSLI
jgi:ribulose-phosphate 3-epimerase